MGRLFAGKSVAILVLTISTLALGACREEEQDRYMIYQPGVYQGKMDDRLSAAQVNAVRNRSTLQIGASLGVGAVGKVSGDVRPPD